MLETAGNSLKLAAAVQLPFVGASLVAHAAVATAVMMGPGAHPATGEVADPVLLVEPFDVAIEQAAPIPPTGPAAPSHAAHAHRHAYPVAPDHDQHPHPPHLAHPVATTTPPPVVEGPATAPDAEHDARPSATPVASTSEHASSAPTSVEAPAAPTARVVYEAHETSTRARLLRGAEPAYPPIARAQEVEGEVRLILVVDADGHVEAATALTRIGFGLEEAALRAARGFVFSPARHQGRSVAVRIPWIISFQLRD